MALGTYRLRKALLRRVGPHSGWLARALRFPNPFAAPWRRPTLDIVAHGGIGDVLMSTPVLRELKCRNPQCRIRFYSSFSSLVCGLPYIDEALPYEARPSPAVYLDYSDDADFVAPRAPLISLLGDRLGLQVHNMRMDCVTDAARVAGYRAAWRNMPRPHVAIVRRSSDRTPNKDWPDEHWDVLVERLARRTTVIDLGAIGSSDVREPLPTQIDLRGRTSLEDLAAAIAAADLYVGPISGPAHIASATNTPGVVIYGGYEPPQYTAQPGLVALGSDVPCAPCWLASPCPYDRKCLRDISPATVEDTIWRVWTRSAGRESA